MVGRKPGDHSVGLFGIMRPLHHRRVGSNRLATLRHGLGKRVQRLVGSAADRHKRVRTALDGVSADVLMQAMLIGPSSSMAREPLF